MDLLGDLGNSDQLTAARAENEVLQEKVKQLSFRVKELSIENESLKAEVELYRNEAALPNFSTMALGQTASSSYEHHHQKMDVDTIAAADNNNNNDDDFMRSGNGVYPSLADITLHNLHHNANPLCCSLSHDDTVLATGGADSQLVLAAWGAACDEGSAKIVVEKAVRYDCTAPVITVAFCPNQKCVAAGCMDGTVHLVAYGMVTGTGVVVVQSSTVLPTKHVKYCKQVSWNNRNSTFCKSPSLLASASADGTVQIHQVSVETNYYETDDETVIQLELVETLHLNGGAVEAMCFVNDDLCCYARGRAYLHCFDTARDFKQRKINLNHGGNPAAPAVGTTTLEDQHVSFAVLDMAPSPNNNGRYLALATDASRNIVMEYKSGLQIRNLYGHQNDGYSNPKIAWSCNGQYILGNCQDDASVCVWDVASSKLIQRMEQHHEQTIRDLFSSSTTDTLVTTSFDKQTKLWFAPV